MLKFKRNKFSLTFIGLIAFFGGSLAWASGPIDTITITIAGSTSFTAGVSTTSIFVNTFAAGGSTSPSAGQVVTIELLDGGSVVSDAVFPSSFTTTGGIINGGNVSFQYTMFRAGSGTIRLRATANGVTAQSGLISVAATTATQLVLIGPGMTFAPGTNPSTTDGSTGSLTPAEQNQAFTVTVHLTDAQFNQVSGTDLVTFTAGTFVTVPSPGNLVGGEGDFQVTMTAPSISRVLTASAAGLSDGILTITTAGPPAQEVFPFPSPFNPNQSNITFRFRLDEAQNVELIVTDLYGQNVWKNELSGSAGTNNVTWNGRNDAGVVVASGVYYVLLNVNGTLESKKRFGVVK